MMICRCSGRAGYTLVGDWWVCATCGLPAKGYAASKVRLMINTTENEEDMGLVYFEGGPLDGHAYETSTLLGTSGLALPVMEYLWTSEKKTSAATNAVAQVWRHNTLASASARPVVPPAPPMPILGVPNADDATRVPVESNPPQADEGAEETVPDRADADVDTGTARSPIANDSLRGIFDGDWLIARRKAMKLSRGVVAERSGLAQSKISSIEGNKEARIKDEERQKLADTLSEFEAERRPSGVDASAHA